MTIGPEPPKANVVWRVIRRLGFYAVWIPLSVLDWLIKRIRG